MLEKYYRINRASGIAIHIAPDGSLAIALCTLKAEGNQLNIDRKVTGLNSIADLKKYLPEKSIVAMNLSGKGVLYKQTEKVEAVDQAVISKILPNANLNDFYVQHFVSGEYTHIALIRKEDANRWLDQLIQIGLEPLSVSLGPFPVINILDQLNFYEGDFMVNGHRVSRDQRGAWTAYSYDGSANAFQVKLASEHIDEALVIPYAAAFQLILAEQIDTVHLTLPTVEAARGKKLDENKLKVRGFLMLTVVFVLLMINYAIFSWLAAANTNLDASVSLNDQNADSLAKISDVVKSKEEKLIEVGWDGGVSKSTLIDQVASLMPGELTLSEISVDPQDLVSSRSQKSMLFFKRKIVIAGHSDEIIPVNEWIARIKTRKWVRKIQLESYTFDSEHNTGEFLVTIDY
jgi:hypothetical protein